MFTTRHYEVVAHVLKENKPPSNSKVAIKQWAAITNQFVQVFSSENSRFDVDLFLKACGVRVQRESK